MQWVTRNWQMVSAAAMALMSAFSFWIRQTTVSRREHREALEALRKELGDAVAAGKGRADAAREEIIDLKTRIAGVAAREDFHNLRLGITKVSGDIVAPRANFEGFTETMKGVERIAALIQENALRNGGAP